MSTVEVRTHRASLQQLKSELEQELQEILMYWKKYTIDESDGGFFGSVDRFNKPIEAAPKGLILHSRILWAFSAAYQRSKDASDLNMADRAYVYLVDHFLDRNNGGAYWSVDKHGNKLEGRKQVYGLAFAIYGFSEYYKVTGNGAALQHAKDFFRLIEENSRDADNQGYLEALSEDWQVLDDLRLSPKDANEKKTMNTHLHIIEGYANLYRVWKDEQLKQAIKDLLSVFEKYFINKQTGHLHLFFDEQWKLQSSLQSFGHDIEAAWLLQECAELIEDAYFLKRTRSWAIFLTIAALEGMDKDGGLWYEYEPSANELIREKHSWPQAEAMVGLFNAWQCSGDINYLEGAMEVWRFIQKHIKDKQGGEWYWGVLADYSVMEKEKAGFWKCPYHNSRACMQILERVGKLLKQN